jgi:hypothetical protein
VRAAAEPDLLYWRPASKKEEVACIRVYRAGIPKWQSAACSVHEGQTYAVAEIIEGHRIG